MEFLRSARFLLLLFLIFTLVVGCIAMIAVTSFNEKWNKFQEKTLAAGYWSETEEQIDLPVTGDDSTWIIRAYEDRIGVFSSDGTLESVLDVYLITLPPSDQAQLMQGIYVSGQESLTALIEDYTG